MHNNGTMVSPPSSSTFMAREARFGAANYRPLPVVLTRGEGAYLWDVEGKRYIDMMSAYSAVSFGHGHPPPLGRTVLVDRFFPSSHHLRNASFEYPAMRL